MSDRQSKNYDEATKAYSSNVAERARSKADVDPATGLGATKASHGSAGISASIVRRQQAKIVGKSQGSYNIEDTDVEEVPAAHDSINGKKRKRNQLKPRRRVGRQKNGLGNNSADMDMEEFALQIIDEAEFRSKKMCSASRTSNSLREESSEGFSAASSWKNVSFVSKKSSASLGFSPEDVSHGSEGNGNDDIDPEEIEIEIIEEAEFLNLKTNFMSKKGFSSKEDQHKGYCAVTPRKDLSKKASSADYCESFCPKDARKSSNHEHKSSSFFQRGSNSEDMVPDEIEIENIDEAEFRNHQKRSESKIERSVEQGLCATSSSKNIYGPSKHISSADHSKPLSHRDYCTGSDVLVVSSSPLARKGSNSEDVVPEEIEIKKIDEAEFRNHKRHSESKIGRSVEQVLCATSSSKNIYGASKHISSADHSRPLSHRDYCTGSDALVVGSSPLARKGKKAGFASCRELPIKQTDESEFLKGKSRITSKIGSSTRQGYSAVTARKSGNIVKEPPLDNYCGSFSSEDRGRDSDKEQTDKSSSFAGKGNKDEGTELGIEEIDESQFRKLAHSISKTGPSNTATSKKNGIALSKRKIPNVKVDKNKKKSEVSSCSRRKKIYEAWKNSLHNDVNDSSNGCTRSYSGSKSSKDDSRASLPEDEISSYGAKHEMNLGVASRTRSKMGSIKKHPEDGNFSLGLSHDSHFSSSFGGKSCESFGQIQELCSYVEDLEVCDEQKNIPGKVSAKKSNDCSKQEGSAVKHAPNIRHKISQNKKSNHEQRSFTKQEFSSRKRQLSNDASSKQRKGGKSHKSCEFNERKEEIHRTFARDATAEEGLGEESICPKCTCSKQSYAQNDSDESQGVNGLHPRDQTEAGVRRQENVASPSHSKDGCKYNDRDDDGVDGGGGGDDDADDDVEDIHEKTEGTSSDFHIHGTSHVTDYIKEPTGSKQVSSKDYDFCSMLADAVLGRSTLLETKGSDEEAMQAPPSQTQTALPSKFWFEDEVPKKVEKTEYEKEVEGLFSELDVNWHLEELESFIAEVDQENEHTPAEETHHARCARGKHELVLQEDEGLICIFCHHVELGPKDILPEWVEKTYQDSGRKRYSEAEQPLEFDELHLESSINNVADFGNGTVWSLKPGMRKSMFEHQREGFEFLWKNLAGSINLDEVQRDDSGGVGGCIISHAPGSGKTRLTINFIETYLKVFPNSMPVIISPASMLLTWEEEFKKWEVGFPFLNLNNPESFCQEKKAILGLLAGAKHRNAKVVRMVKICSWSMGSSVLGISYSLFEKLTGEKYMKGNASQKKEIPDYQMEKMRKILLEKPGLVFLDEGHTPRNQRSNIWNALLRLQTEKRVILSGTPFQNNFAELFNTLRLVRPAIAGGLAKEKMYAEMIATKRMSKSLKYSKGEHSQPPIISQHIDRAVDKLKISMAPFVHIHRGDILQQKVPGLRDCVILLKPSALQKTLIERLQGSSTFEFEHRVALISVHPYLLHHIDSTEEQKSGIDMAALEASKLNPNEGIKTKFILELARLSVVMKEKVLIFSQYLQPLELIKEQLKEIFKWAVGKEILQMQGKLEQKHRQVLINSFNDPKSESKIMLASTKCCSEGISLIGASRVVLLDVVWNPSVERQAICRAYRVGQEKYVYTYHLMTSGTTEADKYCRQAEKERLSELVFSNSSNEGNKQKQPSLGIEDRVLEEMVGNDRLKEMFEKIINQPKDKDLIQTFGLTS